MHFLRCGVNSILCGMHVCRIWQSIESTACEIELRIIFSRGTANARLPFLSPHSEPSNNTSHPSLRLFQMPQGLAKLIPSSLLSHRLHEFTRQVVPLPQLPVLLLKLFQRSGPRHPKRTLFSVKELESILPQPVGDKSILTVSCAPHSSHESQAWDYYP